MSSGDTRRIHRAAYDLMNYRPEATKSTSTIPGDTSLYGCHPDQLADPDSFVSRRAGILRVRTAHRIATSVQVDLPATDDRAVLMMVHRLDMGRMQATVLNFSDRLVADRVTSDHLPAGVAVTGMVTDEVIAEVDEDHSVALTLRPYQGGSLLMAVSLRR